MKNIRLILGVLLFVGGNHLLAQAPVFMSCLGQVNVQDNTDNNALFWNHIELWDPNTQSHDLADAPVDLEAYVSKGCPNLIGYNPNFTLFLDLDGNGSQETEVNGNTFYTSGTVLYNNTNGGSGTSIPFDNRTVSDLDKYRFRLKTTQVNDSVYQLKVIWIDGNGTETKPLLPYGLHRVEWRFSNTCGETVSCTKNLMVKDAAKPTVVCANGLSFNLFADSPTNIWASDLLQYAQDNYTPSPQIQMGVRRVGVPDGQGNTTGFPRNADGSPQSKVEFTCADKFTTPMVELWGMDVANNTAYCETSVEVLDNMGHCNTFSPPNAIEVRINLPQCPEYTIDDVTFGVDSVQLYNTAYLLWGDSIGTVRTVTPQHNQDHSNCVDTWDCVLISRHILNLELFDSPYKVIAADVNNSGTITTFDIVQLRRLILGVFEELPNNTSWRFINKDQVFPNPLNPFTEAFQESTTIVVDTLNPLLEFWAIKIGNVDGCCGGVGLLSPASDRSVISVPDHLMQTGEEVVLTFPGNNDFYAWQMTLAMNGLEIVEIIPFNGLTSENFGVFEENDTTYLTFSAESPQKYFNLRLRALQNGLLSSMLHISNAITPSLSYDANGTPSPITLEFTSNTTEIPVFSANLTPNPWTTQANLQFVAEQSGTGVFTVSNALGQVIYTAKETYSAGPHTIALNRLQIPVAGTYWGRLALNGRVQVVKMIVHN
jgi:hypothetical protein